MDNTTLISNLDGINQSNVLVHIKLVKEIVTKKNERMAFITIYDGFNTVECTLFSNMFDKVMEKLNRNGRVKYMKDVVMLSLKPMKRNGVTSYEIIDAKKL